MTAAPALEPTPRNPSARPSAGLWPGRVGFLAGALLGAVLLVAAYAKAIDPVAFSQQIRAEGLALFGAPFTWAVAAIALEVGLGIALVLNLRRRAVLAGATLLVALFVFLTARTYWRSAHGLLSATDAASCGCFGNLLDRTPAEAFWQDLILLVPALALAWIGRPALRGGRWRAGVAGAAALAAGAFAWAAPGLALDDLATRLAPGTTISALCAGKGSARTCLDLVAPELAEGSHWVVLADGRAPDFDALAAELNRYVASGAEPAVSVLADLTQEERQGLFWRVAPAFDLHETPAALLRPLYRTLPRSFLLEEGRVTRTYRGLPEAIRTPAASSNPKMDDPRP